MLGISPREQPTCVHRKVLTVLPIPASSFRAEGQLEPPVWLAWKPPPPGRLRRTYHRLWHCKWEHEELEEEPPLFQGCFSFTFFILSGG